MGAFNNYINSIKGTLQGPIPLGGTLVGTSESVPVIIAQQIRGGSFVLPSIDALVDLPFDLLELDMEVTVRQYQLSPDVLHPRTRYTLRQLPPDGTRVNQIPSFALNDYWTKLDEKNFSGNIEMQYAPNYQNKRPRFLSTEISQDAYQAGYPTTELFAGGNPADIIWVDTYDPLKNHEWIRQRIAGTNNWGIPISLNSGGDYENNQYVDTIFYWVTKGNPAPDAPVQGSDYTAIPPGWLSTPGSDYATRILTEDLYWSQALRNPYGVLKSNWSTPILISSDPNLVRYGNTPGSSDFLNDTFWRGYFTPGLDTHMASRPNAGSSDWTIRKIDQEAGEYPDLVFKNFPIGVSNATLIAATPTSPYPIGGIAPNDCFDTPPAPEENKILYQSVSTKFADGSLKVPWSLWRRFDGLNTIQAVLSPDPGDTFYQTRDAAGNLGYAFPNITLVASLLNGNQDVLTGFNGYKWYRGNTLIVFDNITRYAINLGVGINNAHQISADHKSLTITPAGIDNTQDYTVGINHVTRPLTDYEASYQLKDATDDGSAYTCDISAAQGTVFKNNTGLYRFDGKFYKGGLEDSTNVVFSWTLKNAFGVVIGGGIRNAGGGSVGGSNYVATTIYVSAADIDQFATIELTAVFGSVTRHDTASLTDVADALALEHLYWGSGTTDPGPPTNFTPRTLTSAQVLALGIGYLSDGTGKWYLIQRINGVWGGPIQIRSEAARPNAGLFLQVYKNVQFSVDGAPAAPAVPGSGSIIPAGWTQVPTAFTGAQDRTYFTVCFFTLRTDVVADPTVLSRANYNPSGSFSAPKIVGISAPPPATPGADGANGWSPLLSLEVRPSDGGVVAKVFDWTGGTGSKPAANTTTSYLTATGLGALANAINLKGAPGDASQVRPQVYVSFGNKLVQAPVTPFNPGAGVWVSTAAFMKVTNNWTQARAFQIKGETPVSNDSGSDSWTTRLLLYDSTSTSLLATLDLNYARMDYVNAAPSPSAYKLKVEAVVIIPAGESRTFAVQIAQTDGGASRYEGGFLEAYGL